MLSEQEILYKIEALLKSILKKIPFVQGSGFIYESNIADDTSVDFITTITIGKDVFKLIGEVKKNLQPRMFLMLFGK